MTVQVEVTPQHICDIFITSVEGGSAYWAQEARFEKFVDGEWKEASYQNVETFTGEWRVQYGYYDEDTQKHTWTDWKTDHDLSTSSVDETTVRRWANVIKGDFDADDADVIVQYLLFNELIFG